MMTRILVASSGHKDFLTPVEACRAIAEGIARSGWAGKVDMAPMADGGDGTIDALVGANAGRIVHVPTRDGLFRIRQGRMGFVAESKLGILEIAEAAGSALLEPHERQTMVATSYGVGEMIRGALALGCERLLVGLGGSIVSDGGIGMAQALGIVFLDRFGKRLQPIANGGLNALSLSQISDIRFDHLNVTLNNVQIDVAADVDIRLLGPHGQARTFGPQKGANALEIAYLEKGFANLSRVIREQRDIDVDVPLAGAAGGLGAGLMAFAGARLYLGAALVAIEINLLERMSASDLVITGEGCLDSTTRRNKAPYYTAMMARKLGKEIEAVVWRHGDEQCDYLDRIFAVEDLNGIAGESPKETTILRLAAAGRQIACRLQQ